MTTSTPRNLPATEGPAMGPASPHSAAANELREEANDGRLIAAAAVCLPAPDRFGTWENEVPSLVCNASAPASGRWKLFWDRYLWVANRRQRGREPLVRSGACHDVRRRRLRREVSRVPRSHRAHAHIAGPPDLAKKLFDLPEGTRVHVEGAIERRSHTFQLGVVNPVHALTVAACVMHQPSSRQPMRPMGSAAPRLHRPPDVHADPNRATLERNERQEDPAAKDGISETSRGLTSRRRGGHRISVRRMYPIAALLLLLPPVDHAAAACRRSCTEQTAACRRAECGALGGLARRDCVRACRERSTCTAPGAAIRTL